MAPAVRLHDLLGADAAQAFYQWPDNKARGDAAYVVGRPVRECLAASHGAQIDTRITALMHDRETDCGCRGNPPPGEAAGRPLSA